MRIQHRALNRVSNLVRAVHERLRIHRLYVHMHDTTWPACARVAASQVNGLMTRARQTERLKYGRVLMLAPQKSENSGNDRGEAESSESASSIAARQNAGSTAGSELRSVFLPSSARTRIGSQRRA